MAHEVYPVDAKFAEVRSGVPRFAEVFDGSFRENA